MGTQNVKRLELEKQLTEQTILEGELGSLRRNAKVYRQQTNSGVFFLSTVSREKSQCKKTKEALIKEMKDLEHDTT